MRIPAASLAFFLVPAAALCAPPGAGRPAAPSVSSTTLSPSAVSTTLAPGPVPSATLAQAALPGSTLAEAVSPGATLAAGSVPSSTVVTQSIVVVPVSVSQTGGAAPVVRFPSDEELHKRTCIVTMPSAYAAHVEDSTGANLNIFMVWYIGTFYNEEGLLIAPISTLLAGGDAKWALLGEGPWWPAASVGYLGGMALPYVGGGIKASSAAQLSQTDFHNVTFTLGRKLGRMTVSMGGLYGIKRAFPLVVPMLRKAEYSKSAPPQSKSLWTLYGGLDFAWKEQHYKVEFITLPEELPEVRPWIIQTHLDGFLGFDLAYLKDSVGYEIIGYYQISFYRWPDKKRLGRERERVLEKLDLPR